MQGLRTPGTVLIALALLTGCSSTQPPPVDIGVAVPTMWSAAVDASEGQTLPLSPRWWIEFADPRLDHFVEEALTNNRDLAAAATRVHSAAALARIAGADLWPQVGVGLDGSRRRQNFIGLPIPGREGEVLSVTTSTFGAGLNLSWEADLWGRLRAQQDAATSRFEASLADFRAAELSLAGQTAKTWFSLLEAEQQIELARATLESRRRSRARIERRYSLGTRPALDLRFAITNEAAATATLAARQRQADLARRQLQILLSRYPDGLLETDTKNPVLPPPPGPIPEGLPSTLVTRRPDLLASESRLAAAGFDVHQARAQLYPQLRLTGSGGTLTRDFEDLLDLDLSVWSLGANLLQPVFQGGRLRAGVELAGARYREATDRHVQLVLQAFSEVESALAADIYLTAQEEALGDAAEQSVAAERLATDRYDSGLQDYLSVLEAQRNSFLAQSELLSARRLRLTNRVELFLALGGGFEASNPEWKELNQP